MNRRLALSALLLATCAALPVRAQEFRVELFSGRGVKALKVRAGTAVRICSAPGDSSCLILERDENATCTPLTRAVRCSSPKSTRSWSHPFVESKTTFDATPEYHGSRTQATARGASVRELELSPTPQGLRVVALMELETYVEGVLGGEAATMPSPAAREAMAIVARTWALRWRGRHHTADFDFCSLTHCQAFRMPRRGTSAADPELEAAVGATRGQVLKYGGRVIDPYFSANCGGMTEAAGEIWPDRAAPYLLSVRDPYCASHEQSSWQRELSLAAVGAVLRDGLRVALRGELADLRVEQKDASGRAHTLRAIGGTEVRVDANAFRYALNRRLGWNTLKSNLYTLERRGQSVVFTGRGLGHGVGLCQAGAEQMARMGIPAPRILAAYFPGTKVVAVEGSDPVVSSEHFELAYPAAQQAWVGETLQTLERFRTRLGRPAEALPAKVKVQAWETTEQFIRATGQPGWAAASNDGRSISLQPLGLLKRKGLLESTLRHELAHLVVHQRRAAGMPRWLEEGMTLYLTGERVPASAAPATEGRTLDAILARPRSELEMRWAYARALMRVRELARRGGEAELWRFVERPAEADWRRLHAME